MDALEKAAVDRARQALTLAAGASASRAGQFITVAYELLKADSSAAAWQVLREHPDAMIQKAAAHSVASEAWSSEEGAALAQAYIQSVAQESLLDQIARYARQIPPSMSRVLIASAAAADLVAEGDPVPVRQQGLDAEDDLEPTRSAAIVVLTRRLLNAIGNEGRRLFEQELGSSITRAMNQAVLQQLVNSDTNAVSGTGDPLGDLRAGLQAAGPSAGFVAAMPFSDVAELATRVEAASGFTVRGGAFRPGVHVIAVDDASETTIVPASRLAVRDFGLQVRSAGDATLDMRADPESPATQVSMFQTNSRALLAERSFILGGDRSGVVVVGDP